jgi:hypothetical protein
MAPQQSRTFLQRLLGAPAAPAAASHDGADGPSPDPADFGTAYGLDLSFAQQAFATPLPPAADLSAPPTPTAR